VSTGQKGGPGAGARVGRGPVTGSTVPRTSSACGSSGEPRAWGWRSRTSRSSSGCT